VEWLPILLKGILIDSSTPRTVAISLHCHCHCQKNQSAQNRLPGETLAETNNYYSSQNKRKTDLSI
jgi:hypothetical protein